MSEWVNWFSPLAKWNSHGENQICASIKRSLCVAAASADEGWLNQKRATAVEYLLHSLPPSLNIARSSPLPEGNTRRNGVQAKANSSNSSVRTEEAKQISPWFVYRFVITCTRTSIGWSEGRKERRRKPCKVFSSSTGFTSSRALASHADRLSSASVLLLRYLGFTLILLLSSFLSNCATQ